MNEQEKEVPPTTLTLENEFGTYTVELKKTDVSVMEMTEEVYFPLMLAAGYQQGSLDKLFAEESVWGEV